MEASAGGAGKTYALVFVLAGILLIGWNYRGRRRIGELQTRIASNEFSSLVMAIVLTTIAFSAMAFLPLMQHGSSTVTIQAEPSSRGDAGPPPFTFEPPNLSPPGVPNDVGDVLQMSSFFFVFIPVAFVALPLLMKRSRYRGVAEAAIGTTFAVFAVITDISTGLFFLPTTVAMLSAATFAQRQ